MNINDLVTKYCNGKDDEKLFNTLVNAYYTSETGKLKKQRWNGGGTGLRYRDGKFRVSTTGGGR